MNSTNDQRPATRGPQGATTRRGFLKRSSLLAAAGAAPYVVPATVFGAEAPSNRITLACIGVGNQGALILQRFLQRPGCQVVAVCDVNRASHGYKDEQQFLGRDVARATVEEFYANKRGRGGYSGCDAYVDFREILTRDDVDAVVICAPDHWHAPMTIAAAEAKKDVYCEKPLGLTIGQGRAMINAVRKHGIVLQTGSHERSNPIVRQACELVRNGYIGDVTRVVTNVGPHNKVGPGPGWSPMPVPEGFDYDLWLGPAPMAPYHKDRCLYNFRFNYDYAGGQVANFGAHSNDMAQWGLGMDGSGPVEIECLRAEFLPQGSLFNAATVTEFRCRYASGVELLCQTAEPSVRCVFEGVEGRVEVENKGQRFKTSPASLADVKLRDDQLLHRSDDHQQDFLDCIKSREEPAAPVEVGHSSAAVCHLGNIAVRMNAKRLQWDPKNEQFVGNDEANEYLNREMRSPWHA
ncbi:MAG TPA: Gfo/Idh/MocA family oxidoreductase [Lacipirellulaceae bacterium]|nr:Gfo/Idh/MocA family oxidoreductase [Lacipirellulaceae bacterium]